LVFQKLPPKEGFDNAKMTPLTWTSDTTGISAKVGQECLNEHWFLSLEDAIEKIEAWRFHFNEERPHSSLGYQSPAAYQALIQDGREAGL